MSDFDGTDLEMMIVFTLVEKGFSMANAKGVIQTIKRGAWREGYGDGVYSVGINSEVMCPYA